MKTLGIRHIALNVKDPQKSKDFYTRVLKMTVEWEPDPDNVYLTTESQDNLALHKAANGAANSNADTTTQLTTQHLDHFGYILATPEDVDQWYAWIQSQGVPILRELKTHRDGARSFYLSDPDGIVIQIIYHPPIAQRSK
jgi:catechol 2,3-dioxygenase-like lactoylglutathione lyase family enzyme